MKNQVTLQRSTNPMGVTVSRECHLNWKCRKTFFKPASTKPLKDVIVSLALQMILWSLEIRKHHMTPQKGSGGPLGVDANAFKRILASKSFKRSSINLCESIATLTRRLCTEFVDPLTIEPILASRLIPLDKGNGKVQSSSIASAYGWSWAHKSIW